MYRRNDLFESILPKTLVGVAVWILIFAMGMALSGLLFFALYQTSVNRLEDSLIKSEIEINKRVDRKLQEIERKAGEGQSTKDLRVSSSDTDLLVKTVGPSIARVEGKGLDGKPTKGSGFVVKSTGSESWIITNNRLVAGLVPDKQPVRIRVGKTELDSEVYATDPARDLALVIFRSGGIRAIPFSKTKLDKDAEAWAVGVKPGATMGVTGSKVRVESPGPTSLALDTDLNATLRGGPLLDKDAKVVAVLTAGRSGDDAGVKSAVPIDRTCGMVLRCPQTAPAPKPKSSQGPRTPAGVPGAAPPPPGTEDIAPPNDIY